VGLVYFQGKYTVRCETLFVYQKHIIITVKR
jgi:hypothetical protein